MNNYYSDKNILVTGGTGFVGSHLVEELVSRKAKVRVVGRRDDLDNLSAVKNDIDYLKLDLRDPKNFQNACKDIELVFHFASTVGAIQYSRQHPATQFTPDVQMAINLLEACSKSNTVDRILLPSSSCIYKRGCSVPFKEEDGFIDDPEPTAFGYGWAKRITEKSAAAYEKEFSLKSAIVRLENVYGPKDNFSVSHAHVIPSLITRAIQARNELLVWGNGQQTRSFLYVNDAIEGILVALEKYCVTDPVNIASGDEVTIKKVAETILEILNKKNIKLVFDSSKPTGQFKKASSVEKMKKVLGFTPRFTLYEGLKRTISWVLQNENVLVTPKLQKTTENH